MFKTARHEAVIEIENPYPKATAKVPVVVECVGLEPLEPDQPPETAKQVWQAGIGQIVVRRAQPPHEVKAELAAILRGIADKLDAATIE